MILTKVFGGMRQHLKTYLDKNKENKEDKQNKEGLQKLQDEMEKDKRMKIWLDNEMYDSLSKNRDQMLMILRGLRNSMKTPTQPKVNQADLFEEFRNIMASFWFVRIFYQGKKDIDEYIKDRMELYFMSIMDESKDYHKFQDMINELITQVLQEN